jgi:hypothetical protein
VFVVVEVGAVDVDVAEFNVDVAVVADEIVVADVLCIWPIDVPEVLAEVEPMVETVPLFELLIGADVDNPDREFKGLEVELDPEVPVVFIADELLDVPFESDNGSDMTLLVPVGAGMEPELEPVPVVLVLAVVLLFSVVLLVEFVDPLGGEGPLFSAAGNPDADPAVLVPQ